MATDNGIELDLEAIARAEAALAALSEEFTDWMKEDCDRLDAARLRVHQKGLASEARDELFRAAHDIKGQAATFGYPLAAEAADSLCRLLLNAADPARIPLVLIDQHVYGVRAIVRENAREEDNAIARALVQSLRRLTDDFLAHEAPPPPEQTDPVAGPPLAPKP